MNGYQRPLGGVSALYLCAASSPEAALVGPPSGCKVEILEDQSTYTEEIKGSTVAASVKHQLRVVTDVDVALDGLASQGVVAWIEFNAGPTIKVGYSQAALLDRPLRLVGCLNTFGKSAVARPCKEWIFESIDGESALE